MELIVISESKLKIMLTAPDMARYRLEPNRMDCADARTRAAFRHIFDDARAEIGFDTEGERLFVQLYASREGGCEIFVTKLGRREEEFPSPSDPWESAAWDPSVSTPLATLSEGEQALLRQVCGYESDEEEDMDREAVYQAAVLFSELGDLQAACRRLLRDGYRGRSAVYITESVVGTDWYLLLELPEKGVYRRPPLFSYVTEYGHQVDSDRLEIYLREHGRLIRAEDGVELLGGL